VQPISDAFRSAIRTGYVISSAVDVLAGGIVVHGGLSVNDGKFTLDRTAAQRRRCSLSVTVTDLSTIPVDESSPLVPFGNEISVSCGWVNPATGLAERVAMGIYAMTDVVVSDTGVDLSIAIDGYDRSWVVSQRKLAAPYVVAAGTDLATAIQALINSVYAGLTYNIVPTAPAGITTPAATFAEGADPWAAALTLADAGGYELYFDALGVVTARPIPDPGSQAPVWTYSPAGDAVPSSIVRRFTRVGVSNDFSVSSSGSNVSAPVRARVSDSNATSPTFTGGAFGDIPTFSTSSLVTSTAAATAAATKALAASLGASEILTVTGVPAPMFDVDDVLSVGSPRLNVAGNYVTDAATLSLRHDGQTQLTLRRVT
jgi:hypothetical protein